MSEETADALRQEIAQALTRMDAQQLQQFLNFLTALEGSREEGEPNP